MKKILILFIGLLCFGFTAVNAQNAGYYRTSAKTGMKLKF